MVILSTILAIVAAIAAALIGAIVWLGGSRSDQAYQRHFVLLAFFVCLWIAGNVAYTLLTGELKYLIALVCYGLAMGLVVQLLLFCVGFAKSQLSTKYARLLVVPGVVVGVAAMIPGIIAYRVEGEAIITNQLTLVIYGLVLVAYIIASCAVLIIGRRRADKLSARGITLILTGMALSGILGAYCNLILPIFGVYWFTQLGTASATLFIGVIAYAIIRHRLFNIKFAVVRTVTYFLALTTMIGVYFGLATLLAVVVNGSAGFNLDVLPNAFIALVLAFIFHPIKRFFDKLTNRIFFQDNYDSDKFFADLTRTLTMTTDLRTLMERAAREISETLRAEFGYLFVYHSQGHHISTSTKPKVRLPIEDARTLDSYVVGRGGAIIAAAELDIHDPIRRMMVSHKFALILPLVRSNQVVGYVCIGERLSNGYTTRDARVLETVADELIIAIQNALSVQEVKELNATLQQRIDEATKELRASNAQLQRLDEAKDEFVSMASHQLRTPLTSVKGYIDMVLEGDAGEISDMQKHLLGEAFTSSERMVHLINDFLNVSRLQTGKFMIDRRQIDLATIVRQEVDGLQTTAGQRQLTLSYDVPSSFPLLYLDEGKIRQVVMNFIDNAIYYSKENTTITITLKANDDTLELTVKDTGIGVPVDEQAQLFTKFYRASNARKQRPDGTGVGLYLAKKVIVAHGGSMVFSSTPEKGSTFGFTLPVKKMALAPVSDTDDFDNQPHK
ncbi:Sensor histidine kinase YycG [compost metagenome]